MKIHRNWLLCFLGGWLLAAGLFARADDLAKLEAEIKKSENPEIIAISRVADYDIYQTGVIMQTVFSKKLEFTVLFLPDETSLLHRLTKNTNWEIRVIFPSKKGGAKEPIVVAKNVKKLGDKEIKKKKLGRAVTLAAWHLDEKRQKSLLASPRLVSARRDICGDFSYSVMFNELPFTPGGYTIVLFSDDLRKHKIIYGY